MVLDFLGRLTSKKNIAQSPRFSFEEPKNYLFDSVADDGKPTSHDNWENLWNIRLP